MKLEDFNYHLPSERIAQYPLKARDHSRMMVVDRKTKSIHDAYFYEMPAYLRKGDLVVVNNSRVIPARLIGHKETGGSIEILLLRRKDASSPSCQTWEVLLKQAKRIRRGTRVMFDNACEAVITDRISEKKWLVSFIASGAFEQFLDRFGRPPLPPYIKRVNSDEDVQAYQTVYAEVPGSVAAPTAGLHFTREILDELTSRGVPIATVALHVGYGTFSPIMTPIVEDHLMEEESYEIGSETAVMINRASRVIAIGTTSTRVLESAVDNAGNIQASSASTSLFIYPGYRFKRVDALLTNFHLPRSSLYLLVCAFAGKDLMDEAYAMAVAREYRFFSYGDCMLIL